MSTRVGTIEALYRYPVKSMAGQAVEQVNLGWHGLDGDRRLGLRRVDDRGGFPWLTATKLPELIRFTPFGNAGKLPSHVRTPEGQELELFGDELANEIGRRHGSPVEMTHLDRGIFDEASISAITTVTLDQLSKLSGKPTDVRRFRPNILIAMEQPAPYGEDVWVGGTLTFGDGDDAPAIAVTNWDERCAMVNYDPDTGETHPEVLKAVVRERDNKAGIYAAVVRRGLLAVGQSIYFTPSGA